MKKIALFLVIILAVLLTSGSNSNPSAGTKVLLPRKLIKSTQVTLQENHRYRICIKFKDEIMGRVDRDNNLYSKVGQTLSSNAKDEMDEINKLKDSANAQFSPVLSRPAEKLEAYKKRAEERSGVAKADLAGMIKIDIDEPGNIAKIDSIVKFLQNLSIIEFVEVRDLDVKPQLPTTPDYTYRQLYRNIEPGMNVDYAWNHGAKG